MDTNPDRTESLPEGAKTIGYIGADGKGRSPTWYSWSAWTVGTVASVFGAEWVRNKVVSIANQPPSEWASPRAGASWGESFRRNLLSAFDPRQWKRNAAWWGTVIGSAIINAGIKHKIEEKTYENRTGRSAEETKAMMQSFHTSQAKEQMGDFAVQDVQHEQRISEPAAGKEIA